MVKEGCMDRVDEVYGFHNVPHFREGDVRVVEGGGDVMSSSNLIKIWIKGKGGHGSMPH